MKNVPSIIKITIIIVMVILLIIPSADYSEIKKYITIFLFTNIISILGIIIVIYLTPTEVINTLIKILIGLFFVVFYFYFLEKGSDETNSFLSSAISFGPSFILTFLFKNKVEKNTWKIHHKNNWYDVDSPLRIFKNGGMILKRDEKFLKIKDSLINDDFIKIIFVDKNYKKIESPYDEIYNQNINPRRVKKNRKIGFIDNDTMELIIGPQFDSASDFWGQHHPTSCVMKNGTVYYIDIKGKTISNS